MHKEIRIIRSEEQRVSNWSGGKTTQLYIYPEDSDYSKRNFSFRLSSATIEEAHSVFTALPGVYRHLMPLSNDIQLSFEGKAPFDLPAFTNISFDGEKETESFGQCTDFNLMLKGGFTGKIYHIAEQKKELVLEKDLFLFACYCYTGNAKVSAKQNDVPFQNALSSGELLVASPKAKVIIEKASADCVLVCAEIKR